MSEQKELRVGIDFGTCNIKAAVFGERKNRVDIHKFNKNQLSDVTPNIVDIKKDSIAVGSVKYKKKQEQTIVTCIKRHLEEENWKIFVPSRSREMTAVDIATEEFRWIRENIENKYKSEITEAVITVPVCFSEIQKNRIKKAAETAGIKVKETVTEPFAAVFSYEDLLDIESGSNILIFDFGGGTIDISIFNVSKAESVTRVETMASRGIRFGGNDITELMYKEILGIKYQDKIDLEIQERIKHSFLNDDNYSDSDKTPDSEMFKKHKRMQSMICHDYFIKEINNLKEEICESEDISSCMFTECLLEFFENLEINYSYSELENLLDKCEISKTIEQTIFDLVDTAMIDTTDISKVIMVGGSSKINYFRKLLKNVLEINDDIEDDVFIDLDSDAKYNAVAVGATEYVKNKDTVFDVINRLSYEIGTIDESGKYQRRMDLNSAYNDVPSLRRPVSFSDRDEKTYKVNMYQVFFDTTKTKIDVARDAVYMGCFVFDKTKYNISSGYLMELFVDSKGILFSNIFDSSGNKIETLSIMMEV